MKKWLIGEAIRAGTIFRNVYFPLETRKDLLSSPTSQLEAEAKAKIKGRKELIMVKNHEPGAPIPRP